MTTVTVNAVSQTKVGEEVIVQAAIHTGNNRVEYVHNVNATLILQPNIDFIAGSNSIFIGEMGPGPVDALCNWTIVFLQPGTYDLTVNVSCIDSIYIPRWMTNSTIIEVYDYPHAEFTYTGSSEAYINQTIVFNATESYAQGPNREIVSYRWNFGDGVDTTLDTPIANHTYETVGNFQISLEIIDNRQLSSMATANITVGLFGDLNSDREVNVLDISIVALSFESRPGDEGWNPKADINHDEVVNIIDIALVSVEFGKEV